MNIKLRLLLASMLTTTMAFAGDTGATYGGESITHANSPHNISVRAAVDINSTAANGEICVFCHTPHSANVAFNGAPIWNKNSTNKPAGDYLTAAGYTMYGATVGGSTTATVPANPSLACLSCHDGISAVDSILNAPGSGFGSMGAGTKSIAELTVKYGGNIGAGSDYNGTAGGKADLSNDHPISITYVQGRGSLKDPTTALAVGDQAWLVPGGGTNIEDILRGAGNDQVECVSCHDPHNATGSTQAAGTEVNFLRHTNKGSQLCIGCHDK